MYISVLSKEFLNVIESFSETKINNFLELDYNIHNDDGANQVTSIQEVTKCHKSASRLSLLFPGVFRKKEQTLFIPSSIRTQLLLKYHGINFTSHSDQIQIFTYAFCPLYFKVQYLNHTKTFVADVLTTKNSRIAQETASSDSINWITSHIGEGFSYGQLLDFCDRTYDEYKQTHISPFVFRNIFFSFLHNVDKIGEKAFDNYIELRDTNAAWKNALSTFLKSNYNPKPSQLEDLICKLFIIE